MACSGIVLKERLEEVMKIEAGQAAHVLVL